MFELVTAGWILIGCQCFIINQLNKIVLKVIPMILFLCAVIIIAVV